MLGLVWRYRWGCIKVIGIQIALLTLGLSGLGLMGLGIDHIRYSLAVQMGTETIPKTPKWPFGIMPPEDWTAIPTLTAIAVAILLFAAVRSLLNMSYAVAVNRLLQGQVVVDLRTAVYRKMQRLSFRFFDSNASGSIINRVTTDVQNVRNFVDGVVVQSAILALSLVVYLVYMTRINPALTLACMGATPLILFTTFRFSRRVRPAYAVSRDLFDEQILSLSESIQGVHVVRGFARQPEEIAKFDRAADKVADQKSWIFNQISRFQPTIGFLSQTNIVVLLAYGGYMVIRHETGTGGESAGITVGQLLVFSGLLQQFSGQVSNIATIADNMQQSITSARRVFEVLDSEEEIKSPPDAVALPRSTGAVELDKVSFSYRPGTPVLHEISLRAAPGQCVAVLGPTGSGKSTLLSLIPRFYDTESGVVRVDGCDVRSLDLEDLRRNIGIVFQESFLFSNTIRANIAFGNTDATDEQVERAAKMACAHDFITAMPDGYDTILREAGSNLSGGQRQRIAIARALLTDPPILLLDDPTAAIDAETEADIMAAINTAMTGRTTFIVAHRLSTLRQADMVVVLDRGRVVQMGTHDKLMTTRGLYRHAADMQMPDADSAKLLLDHQETDGK
ncbi:MAG: ABC transporter ATP-binding protein [Lentisphaerae bacterium]|nr:ABC transporter ATP-binding protein [Lentisphaerota bacterium]